MIRLLHAGHACTDEASPGTCCLNLQSARSFINSLHCADMNILETSGLGLWATYCQTPVHLFCGRINLGDTVRILTLSHAEAWLTETSVTTFQQEHVHIRNETCSLLIWRLWCIDRLQEYWQHLKGIKHCAHSIRKQGYCLICYVHY